MQHRIRSQLRSRGKGIVAFIKLSLKNAKPIELRKQKSRSLAHWPYRIVRMLLLPHRKIFLRPGKIKIVEAQKAPLQCRAGNRVWLRRSTQRQTQPQGCYHTDDYTLAKLSCCP